MKSIVVINSDVVEISQGPAFNSQKPNEDIFHDIAVKSGNTWRNNNTKLPRKKQTADVFQVAVRENGLPIAVVLDGCDKHADYSEIKTFATLLIAALEERADDYDNKDYLASAITKNLIDAYSHLDSSNQNKFMSTASMSAVFFYRDHKGQLKAVSIGTGDTMIALDDGKTVRTVIAARNVKGGGPLPFPSPPEKDTTLENVLANLEINILNVKGNERFLFLTDGAYENLALKSNVIKEKGSSVKIMRTILKSGSIKSGSSVDELVDEADNAVSDRFDKESPTTKDLTIGDDVLVGQLTVPTQQKQGEVVAYLKAPALMKEYQGKSGYVGFQLDRCHTPEFQKKWQFRIAITPDKENLNKAAHALKTILIASNLPFKILALNHEDASSAVDLGLDGTQTSYKESDRDQRGKEICVYIGESKDGSFSHSPEELKKLILKCLNALQAADVKFYSGTPYGDKKLSSEVDVVLPVSYTAFKPYQQRHGLLHQSYFNPNEHADPFDSVHITTEDLITHEVSTENFSLPVYMDKRVKNLINSQGALLQQVFDLHSSREKGELADLIAKPKDNGNLSFTLEELSFLSKSLAKDAEYYQDESGMVSLTGHSANTKMFHTNVRQLVEGTVPEQHRDEVMQKCSELLPSAIEESDLEAKKIIEEFKSSRRIKKLLNFAKSNPNSNELFLEVFDGKQISEQELNEMVNANPGEMQLLYRRLMHFIHDVENYQKEVMIAEISNILCDKKNPRDEKLGSIYAKMDELTQLDFSVKEYAELFNSIKNSPELTPPSNSQHSAFFRLSNNTSNEAARNIAIEIRDKALELLHAELDEKGDDHAAKVKLLNWAKKQDVFCAHRNVHWYQGAFGRTRTVINIDQLINTESNQLTG